MPPVTTVPEPQEQGNGGSLLGYPGAGIPSFFRTSYTLNGIPMDADFAMTQMSAGAAYQCPDNNCGPRRVVDPNGTGFVYPEADANGNFTYWGTLWAPDRPTLNIRPSASHGTGQSGQRQRRRRVARRRRIGKEDSRRSEPTQPPQNPQPYDPRVDFRDYAFTLSTENTDRTDCLKLALLIYKAGQVSGNDADRIVTTLLSGLTEFGSVGYRGRTDSDPDFRVGVFQRDPFFGQGFGDSGFIGAFQDGSNQVRHFIGWFAAGYFTDAFSAGAMLDWSEGSVNSNNPDIALGQAGIRLGAGFKGDFRQLAQDFWHGICGQSTNLNLP